MKYRIMTKKKQLERIRLAYDFYKSWMISLPSIVVALTLVYYVTPYPYNLAIKCIDFVAAVVFMIYTYKFLETHRLLKEKLS